jgi:hypothetical protein
MTEAQRLRRLERLLTLRRNAADEARRAFATRVSQSAAAAERVVRVQSLMSVTQTGPMRASSLAAAAQLRALLQAVDRDARLALAASVAERRVAETELATAGARAERVAERALAARHRLLREVDRRQETASPPAGGGRMRPCRT